MTDHITEAEIARLRELDAKATKGPWESGTNPAHFENVAGQFGSSSNYWVVRPAGEFPHGDWIADCGRAYGEHEEHNAALIAEYRSAVPRLLDEIERLKTVIAMEARDDD